MTGSKSSVKRSYINMGKADLHIDKLSGQFTFSYQHDKNAPDTILGGEVHIKGGAAHNFSGGNWNRIGYQDGIQFRKFDSNDFHICGRH